ncbi:nuclear transport factor 2 family protein [Rhodococcus opacus]|uniref:nuclear transport factor 2 family protein n=1 Tax=Rhodococcus opacus TaxID=37919 RepID=UPI002475F644|nr:nuclear transport factor 2 family protein [Rhodococcus opacus]
MTREQRKSVALELFKRFDTGSDFLELFDDHATAYFPKWGVANGKSEISRMFGEISVLFTEFRHFPEYTNFVVEDDLVVAEGITYGTTADGTPWRPGLTHAGRFVDIMEIRDHKIHRLFTYVDPDFAGADTTRYPWLAADDA